MNCIIVDDESPARRELAYFINNFSSIKILEEFDDGIKAMEYIQSNEPDILFLDINMPKLDGITLSKVIKNFKKRPMIIFITAHREYAVEAFELEAFDYILKPYSESRIVNTLLRLDKCSNINSNNNSINKITLWKDDKLMVININDIYYCEAHEREVHIYTKDNKFILVSSISDFLKKLPDTNFFRSHRSYIVNLEKVCEIVPWFNNTYMIKLQGIDDSIPVSRNNISEFKMLMGI